MDEYFRVSNCKNAKEMWDTLQVSYEGTTDVKRSRINTLTHEYELFKMLQYETIEDMQKRFTHMVNHLASLEKGEGRRGGWWWHSSGLGKQI